MPSAAILAGGSARRFEGQDKSALVFARPGDRRGRTILEYQRDELATLTDDIMIVGHRSGPSGGRALPGLRAVADRTPGCGPLSGLQAALTEAREEVLALIACDMPLVTARFIAQLLAHAHEADAVVPRTKRGYHPLCAVYTRGCLNVVSQHLKEGRLTMTALLEALRVRVVEEEEVAACGDPERLLANVNTRAEYDRIQALASHEA
jgi:molybdopterin-guanine dinucleotide biosynthesis protein A